MNDRIRPLPGIDGWRHCHFDSVGSTNDIVVEFANDGDPGQLWVTAGVQKAGKARRGRSWVSESGNLYASLLLIDPAPASKLATLPLVVSLALHQAISEMVASGRPDIAAAISIKWPNDILFDGKKMSGILLEATHDQLGRLAVVIGCGVNCAHYPDNPLYPATSLLERGFDVSPEALLLVLARHLVAELAIWDKGDGFGETRAAWLKNASGLGQPIVARLSDGEHTGHFESIDEQGLLVLKLDDGSTQLISSADIFFGNLAISKA